MLARFLSTYLLGAHSMLHRYRAAALLALAIVLAGCSGNYKFSDDQYRPLGDPQAEKRGH
ncbi:hypothetical protein FIV02_00465 [Pseudomonas sp. THAF187a]|uniref:Type VI secretion protein (Modular protein) n=2 Tax=Ectopseudomonas TaxID=3236654 RepID=A0A653B4A7_ECTOL|nr:hypothetical protein FIV02_00465 [Pseudomonas sp. THAF187a]QFT40230.1 hypothetical protein FIU98_00465 [Pseudomonas sp. THAF42]